MSVGTAFYPRNGAAEPQDGVGRMGRLLRRRRLRRLPRHRVQRDPRGGRRDRHEPAVQVRGSRHRTRHGCSTGSITARRLEAPGRPGRTTRPGATRTGKVLDDGTITRLADTEYRVTAADPCYRWFLLNATGLDVEVAGRHRATLAALALQGQARRDGARGARPARTGPTSGTSGTARDRDRRRRRRRHPHRLHRRPRVRAVDPGRRRPRRVGRAVRRGRAPTGSSRPGIRALDVARVEAGLILIEAEYTSARHAISARAVSTPRSRSGLAVWSTSARRRTSTVAGRCSQSTKRVARPGGSSASSSTGRASRGCSPSTASHR